MADLRTHLLALAGRHGIDPAHIHRLAPADILVCDGWNEAQLVTYLELLDVTATRWAGKVPMGHTAAIHCRNCGPVWVHPSLAAALPVVSGWPRALGCPWCVVRKAGVAFSCPPVRCGDCELFRSGTINPEAGMGECASGKGWNYPMQRNVCETFQPSGQYTRKQSAREKLE